MFHTVSYFVLRYSYCAFPGTDVRTIDSLVGVVLSDVCVCVFVVVFIPPANVV